MTDEVERKILDMVEQGQITAEEGLRLMNAMNTGQEQIDLGEEGLTSASIIQEDDLAHDVTPLPAISEEELKRMKHLKRWWVLPFGVGLLITTLGAVWMYSGYTANGFGWGFWLAWLPFILGIFILAISFQSSNGLWLHVRIQQKPGETPQRIAISLPVPISLTQWVLRTFGNRIPGLRDQPLENISEILNNLSPEEPFYVHVDDDDGEIVEVFIG